MTICRRRWSTTANLCTLSLLSRQTTTFFLAQIDKIPTEYFARAHHRVPRSRRRLSLIKELLEPTDVDHAIVTLGVMEVAQRRRVPPDQPSAYSDAL